MSLRTGNNSHNQSQNSVTMKENRKKIYQTPEMEMIVARVEKGFQVSGVVEQQSSAEQIGNSGNVYDID